MIDCSTPVGLDAGVGTRGSVRINNTSLPHTKQRILLEQFVESEPLRVDKGAGVARGAGFKKRSYLFLCFLRCLLFKCPKNRFGKTGGGAYNVRFSGKQDSESEEFAMRLMSYLTGDGPHVVATRGHEYVDLTRGGLPGSMRALLELGDEGLRRAAQIAASAPALDIAGLKLLPPVPDPQKVICIGLNYADHAREGGVEPPEEPVLFNKFPTALIAHDDPIVLPRESSEVDYEAELVVVIGRGGRHIARERAYDHVAGYCAGHDVSARDWQLRKPGKQWLLGKTFDTFAPYGPALVTRDEVPEPGKLRVQFRLNGQTMQDSNTAQFIFPIDELVAYISQVCTLRPGDLIFTGTPPGVGFARKPPVFLKHGDVAEVEIEGVGVLKNPVVAS